MTTRRGIPTRDYWLEHSLGRGLPWHKSVKLAEYTRREAEDEMQLYKDANPGSRFRLSVVKP